MARKEPKVAYAVFKGRFPGVYSTWAEAEAQVSRYQGADHKGYTSTDGGRAKAEEDFKNTTQQTLLMGNIVAKAVGGYPQNDTLAPQKFQALFSGATGYEATDPKQQPLLCQGPTSSIRKSSHRKERTALAELPYATPIRDLRGTEGPIRAPGPESAAHGDRKVPSSNQKREPLYPSLPKTTPREKKARPISWEVEHDLPKKIQRLEDDNSWFKRNVIPRSKSGASLLKNTQRFIADSDASDLADSSSDDRVSGNGVCHKITSDESSCRDSSSDESSSGNSVPEESITEVEETVVYVAGAVLTLNNPISMVEHPASVNSRDSWQATHSFRRSRCGKVQSDRYGLGNPEKSTTSRQMQQYHHDFMPNAYGPNQSPLSCPNPLLDHDDCNTSEEEYEYVGNITYPSLPDQQQPYNRVPAPDFIPLASSDNGEASDETFTRPNPPSPTPTEPELCEEQASLVNLIASGKNVFYTGSAGCGKSTVLKAFVKRLRDAGKRVQIVAPTGRAAVDIDGTTFWSFAGWHQDSMKKPMCKLAEGVRNFKWVNRRLCKTDVLVIDEISMMENHHFERLNLAMKSARNNVAEFGMFQAKTNSIAPFGGVQLVVTGDFCQLPPVLPFQHCLHCGLQLFPSRDGQVFSCVDKKHGPFLDIDKWAFRSAAWKECLFVHVNLTHIHRQSDREFITILQQMRFGRPLSEKDRDLLLNHESDTTNAVKLFPLLRQVREVNDQEFTRLRGPTISFNCLDNYHWNREHGNLKNHFTRSISDNSLECQDKHRFERRVEMKRHMLIILLANLDIRLGLINGAQGIILGFLDHDPAQIPEQFGNRAEIKKMQIEEFVDRAETKKWPLVQFRNGTRTFTRLIKPYCTVNALGDSKPYSWVSRTQLPLLPAWAISIHKSQGMTLSRVEVNVSKSFEKGQSYVALSRATSLGGLKVQALDDCNQGGNVQVIEFLREKFGDDVVDGAE